MPEFPSQPIAPSEFFERFVPSAFAEAGLPAELRGLRLELGVRLEGEGGGEWLYQLEGGALHLVAGSRESAALTLVQSVADWRGALWEGRGGVVGRQAAGLLRPGARSESGASPQAALGADVLGQLQHLDGMIRMAVTGGDGGDWSVAFRLGPGPIPAEPTATLTIAADDAEALVRGELAPLEAFMAGRIQVDGDMTLVMQLQAIQMQASAGSSGSSAA
jgi:hypothetical protein